MQWLLIWAVVIAAMLVIDLAWLTAMRRFYRARLGPLLAARTNWPAAIVFYVIYTAGLVFFAIAPAFPQGPATAAMLGAAYGLVTYATYDLTNQATLAGWPVAVTFVDIAWGIVLSAGLAALGAASVGL